MMKIEKMDREIERKHKEQLMEIKNKDIEEIIQRTRREMKNEENLGNEESIPHQMNPNFGANNIYFDNEELDNMIDHGHSKEEMMHSLNQYPQNNNSKSNHT